MLCGGVGGDTTRQEHLELKPDVTLDVPANCLDSDRSLSETRNALREGVGRPRARAEESNVPEVDGGLATGRDDQTAKKGHFQKGVQIYYTNDSQEDTHNIQKVDESNAIGHFFSVTLGDQNHLLQVEF